MEERPTLDAVAGLAGVSAATVSRVLNRSAPVSDSVRVDAYLWIKTPGESDGSCTRGTVGPGDPEWGVTDPAAGAWFPQQALQLAQLANPALLP